MRMTTKTRAELNAFKLVITDIRYFETRRGLGYECQTNVTNVTIWNDGMGGGTYMDGKWSDIKQFNELNELDLENLINIFEGQPFYERV